MSTKSCWWTVPQDAMTTRIKYRIRASGKVGVFTSGFYFAQDNRYPPHVGRPLVDQEFCGHLKAKGLSLQEVEIVARETVAAGEQRSFVVLDEKEAALLEPVRKKVEYALERRQAQDKAKVDSSRGGKAPKRREAIFQAIIEMLRNDSDITANELWNSFPDTEYEALEIEAGEVTYALYRSAEKLIQICHAPGPKAYQEKTITRGTFGEYVSRARKVLKK